MNKMQGQLSKMVATLSPDKSLATYQIALGDQRLDMNPLIGQRIHLSFLGQINCQSCNRLTKKSYSGGFCFPCARKLAQCDLCIMKPETCHYAAGTCREPEWGEKFCMQDHFVYLANSGAIKVGITRHSQVPTRWIDQGATQALPIFRVKTRYQSGVVEVMFKSHVSDRTDWRKMLKGQHDAPVDLIAKRDELMAECQNDIIALQQRFGEDAIAPLQNESIVEINYPVQRYPEKVTSLNFDKTAEITGVLQGIKGQYLILDTGVLNIRKFSAYHVSVGIE